MITFRTRTEVKDDHRVVLMLPPEVPTGQAELVVTVDSPPSDNKQSGTNLPDWAETQAGRNGNEQARYPLRGSVLRYDRPTEPVAEGDWEALE
jgi:hypothetical protein